MKHTPGPWNFHPHYDTFPGKVGATRDGSLTFLHISIAKGETIIGRLQMMTGDGGYPSPTDPEETRANARLCVEAPGLLKALEHCAEALAEAMDKKMWADGCEALDEARSAIARATGGAR